MRPAGRGREEDGLSVVAIRRDAEEGEEASGEAKERARNQNNLEMRRGERVSLYILANYRNHLGSYSASHDR